MFCHDKKNMEAGWYILILRAWKIERSNRYRENWQIIYNKPNFPICQLVHLLGKKYLATKLTRMNLHMFIYGNYSFPIYCSVPLVREVQCHKFLRMISCGSFLSTFIFFPKDMPKCTHKNHCIIQLQTDFYLPRNKHPWETLADL